ncbi:MAG TPA: AAA family ATPase [Pyrinomonadaceae bacterium]|nr:AAA family ATPase [Pyrinomonadaceae bacterium]
MFTSFLMLGLRIANAEGGISTDEASLICDVQDVFLHFGKDSLSAESITENCRNTIRRDPSLYREVSMPMVVSALEQYDSQNGTDYALKAKAMFFQFANAVAKADGKIGPQEERALAELSELFYGGKNVSVDGSELLPQHDNEKSKPRAESVDVLLTEFQSLVGLDAVKADVTQMVNFLRVQQVRHDRGLAAVPVSRHLVFYGNPGTGKTTVARLLSRIYKALGVVSRGHLVETDRSGLVAGYVGQTAIKVREVVEKAKGGILFIDEAYSLVSEGQDFGQEAIDTLLKLMEDNRDDLVVVVAGYTDRMSKFLTSNPGLKSRFNKFFHFDDYGPEQLLAIFISFCSKSGVQLTKDARKKAFNVFQSLYEIRDESFGNARLVRNTFESAVHNQANRIVAVAALTETVLQTLEASDIPGESDNDLDKGIDTSSPQRLAPQEKIRFKCPHCSKSLKAPLSAQGASAKCPG